MQPFSRLPNFHLKIAKKSFKTCWRFSESSQKCLLSLYHWQCENNKSSIRSISLINLGTTAEYPATLDFTFAHIFKERQMCRNILTQVAGYFASKPWSALSLLYSITIQNKNSNLTVMFTRIQVYSQVRSVYIYRTNTNCFLKSLSDTFLCASSVLIQPYIWTK